MKHYYGPQTQQALENFPFPLPTVSIEFIHALAEIKKAAAIAHMNIGALDNDIALAITETCDEIAKGTHDAQFVTAAVQGGAGTSINMNVNEVVAARASEISGKHVHPNDHVNMSQSTNDVNPSALRITSIRLTLKLLAQVDHLIETFQAQSEKYKHTKKLARTHLQDAIPTTVGEEFASYTAILTRDKKRIEAAMGFLYDLNLGGTAIGNKLNASESYIEHVYTHLEEITGITVRQGENFMSLTSATTDFCQLSSVVTMLALDISKIATDLRILSSGPNGGIGEVSLQPLQPGSSIMPGKVNPVAAESMNQIFYYISGKNLTVHHASEAAQLELAIMFPVIADSIISSLKLLTSGIQVFADKCIATIHINEKRCLELLEKSTAYATLLTPILGYDTVSNAVKEAIKTHKSIRTIMVEKKLLTDEEFTAIVASYIMY